MPNDKIKQIQIGSTQYDIDPAVKDNTPTEDSENVVTSGGVYSAIEDVREVAEGKKQTYVASAITNEVLNSQASEILIEDSIYDVNNKEIKITNVSIGDTFYITELNIPDRWVSNFKNSSLPSNYIQLTYLYSDGNQYINTNTALPENGKLIIRNKIDSTSSSSKCTFGALANGSKRGLHDLTTTTSNVALYMGTGSRSITDYTDEWHILELTWNTTTGSGSGTYKVDSGAAQTMNITGFDSTTTLGLFCRHLGAGFVDGAKCYISDCEIYNYTNGEYNLQNKYIPCYEHATGGEGLYDTINNQFYNNLGSGTFTRGEELQRIGYYLSKLETAKVPITSISKNGTTIQPINGNVNITIPTKTSDITNDSGFITLPEVPQEIFKCTYGSTTYAEITTAIAAGKLPIATNSGIIFTYLGIISSKHYFGANSDSRAYRVAVDTNNNWTYNHDDFEFKYNKTTSISSTSTDVQYPSAKAVYTVVNTKQDSLTEGTGIDITNNVISVDDIPTEELAEDLTFTPTNTVGGAIKGTTYSNKSVKQLLEQILCPYVKPTSFSITTNLTSTYYERGVSQTITTVKPSFTAGSRSINSIKIGTSAGDSTYYSGASATSGTNITLTTSKSDTNTMTIYARISDGTTNLDASKTINFCYKTYYGMLPSQTFTTTSLSSALLGGKAKSATSFSPTSTNTFPVYAYPAEYADLTSVKDGNGFENLTNFTKTTTTINSVSYKVYTYNNAISGEVKFTFN